MEVAQVAETATNAATYVATGVWGVISDAVCMIVKGVTILVSLIW